MDVINNQLQASHSKAEYICLEKMLLERKHVSDFKQVLKEIDYISMILRMPKHIQLKFLHAFYR